MVTEHDQRVGGVNVGGAPDEQKCAQTQPGERIRTNYWRPVPATFVLVPVAHVLAHAFTISLSDHG
jgi:hypothetical protein